MLARGSRKKFVPSAPSRLHAARTCYDHVAGALGVSLGVSLHDRFVALGWLSAGNDCSYDLTLKGTTALEAIGLDIQQARALRRRFAFACLDWSERRSHIGGALGAGFLQLVLSRRWVTQDLDGRALHVTSLGRRELPRRFGVHLLKEGTHLGGVTLG